MIPHRSRKRGSSFGWTLGGGRPDGAGLLEEAVEFVRCPHGSDLFEESRQLDVGILDRRVLGGALGGVLLDNRLAKSGSYSQGTRDTAAPSIAFSLQLYYSSTTALLQLYYSSTAFYS